MRSDFVVRLSFPQAMNSTVVEQQPVLGGNYAMSLFFLAFIIICVFFMLNLVIGVTINQVWKWC